MGILDTLKQVKETGFDAKKDNVNQNSKIDPGTYPVRLKSVQANVDQKGKTQLAIVLEVVSGKDKNRTESIFLSFDEGLPEFVLEKNGRLLLKLAALTGVEFSAKDLEDEFSTAAALEKAIGKQIQMKLTTSPNKKNPDYPYRNYEFSELAEDSKPFGDEIEEDDLPF